MGFEIVVEEHALLCIPEILVHLCLASLRELAPILCISFLAQNARHLREIGFRLIQQAVEADGSVVMRLRAVRAEPERNIKSRFAHAPIALVVVMAQRHRSKGVVLLAVRGGLT